MAIIIPGEELLFLGEKRLPSGTVLFEQYGANGGGSFTTHEIILPTAQEIEIICVGGGGPVVGTALDL